jgi:hypothetical protein
MQRWIFVLIAAACVTAFVLWQRSGTKTAYVNGLPEYRDLPGQEYIFQRDCYIFKFADVNTAYPLVGANAPDLPVRVEKLPEKVSRDSIGQKLPGIRILEVARTGDRFRIISVRRETSPKSVRFSFEILFVDEATRKYPRLDAYYIMDHAPEKDGKAPGIFAEFAVPRVKG